MITLLTFMFSGWFVLSVLLNAVLLAWIFLCILWSGDFDFWGDLWSMILFVLAALAGFVLVKSWFCIINGLLGIS